MARYFVRHRPTPGRPGVEASRLPGRLQREVPPLSVLCANTVRARVYDARTIKQTTNDARHVVLAVE
jgi:hypothetical protein